MILVMDSEFILKQRNPLLRINLWRLNDFRVLIRLRNGFTENTDKIKSSFLTEPQFLLNFVRENLFIEDFLIVFVRRLLAAKTSRL